VTPQSPSSISKNPFLLHDVKRRNSLTPPWEKTAVPLVPAAHSLPPQVLSESEASHEASAQKRTSTIDKNPRISPVRAHASDCEKPRFAPATKVHADHQIDRNQTSDDSHDMSMLADLTKLAEAKAAKAKAVEAKAAEANAGPNPTIKAADEPNLSYAPVLELVHRIIQNAIANVPEEPDSPTNTPPLEHCHIPPATAEAYSRRYKHDTERATEDSIAQIRRRYEHDAAQTAYSKQTSTAWLLNLSSGDQQESWRLIVPHDQVHDQAQDAPTETVDISEMTTIEAATISPSKRKSPSRLSFSQMFRGRRSSKEGK